MIRLALAGAFGIALLVLTAAPASAQKASCAVLEVHANKGAAAMPKTIPPKLARKLQRAPFTAWKNFRMVSAVRRPFAKAGASQKIALRRGSLELRRHPNANNQYKLMFLLKNSKGKRVLRTKVGVSPKTYFLVAGLPLKKGSRDAIQVLALTCMPVP